MSAVLMVVGLSWETAAIAQISAAGDGTGTRINRQAVSDTDRIRDRFLIEGGTRSGDRQNLFHSFEEFGLSADQIATFLSDPDIRNILSRVVGGNPSIIDGLIEVAGSDANLYLLNPAGVVFGPNSRLDVSGDFTATTATGIGFGDAWFNVFGDSDYANLVGDPTGFVFATDAPGSIVNAGTLRVSPGSALTLLGGTVINTGILSAPGGEVTIAAIPGDRLVRISHEGMLLSLEISTLDDSLNPANSGLPDRLPFTPLSLPELLTGHDISNATGISTNPDGTIRLMGSGLSIPIEPGTAIASGTLNTSITEGISTERHSTPQSNPQINVLGDRVAVINATLDASRIERGGTIRVGGDYQGQGTVPNAQATYVDSASVLRADGLDVPESEFSPSESYGSDGGQIITWADDSTWFYGRAIARGGDIGNGGLIEISGKENLAFDGTVDVGAVNGDPGTVLFDPNDIFIILEAGPEDGEVLPDVPNAGDPTGAIFFNDDPTATFTLGADAVANINGTVQLQAHSDIIVQAAIVSSTIDNLILQAGRNIAVDDRIELNNGNFLARINDENANPLIRDAGEAEFTALGMGDIITTNGDITIEMGTFGGSSVGIVNLSDATIRARNGAVNITGRGGVSRFNSNPGVTLSNTTIEALDSGSITIRGVAGGTAGDVSDVGVSIPIGSAIRATGTADILIEGTAGNALTNNIGVEIGGLVAAAGGEIQIVGSSDNGLGGTKNYGILLQGGSIQNERMGAIALEGTVGSGLSGSFNTAGIALLEAVEGPNSTIEIDDGTLSLTGLTDIVEPGNPGIRIGDGSSLTATGNGEILVTGDAPTAAGIVLDDGIIDTRGAANSRVVLTADEIDVVNGAQVRGNGELEIQPLTPSVDIGLGGASLPGGDTSADGQLTLTTGDLAALPNGFSQVTIGRADSRGQIRVNGEMIFDDPTTLRSPNGNGSIRTTGGSLRLVDDASLTLLANQGITTGDIIAPGRAVTMMSTRGAIDTTGGILNASDINGGGSVVLTAAENITVRDITTSSRNFGSDESGAITSGNAGTIDITSSRGTVRVEGFLEAVSESGGNAGDGGRIQLNAERNVIVRNGVDTSTFAGQDRAGQGGAIRLNAGRDLTVQGILDSSAVSGVGNSGNGGRLRLTARRNVTLAGLDTSAELEARGGAARIAAAQGRVIINADVPSGNADERSSGSAVVAGNRGVSLRLTPIGLDDGLVPDDPTISTSGGQFVLRAGNGPVEIRGIEPVRIATRGGRIRLQGTEVTTQNIILDSSQETGDGGAIRLIADEGAIAVGNLDSSGDVGGSIRVESALAITTGTINTSGRIGDGGDVILDPPGDIEVTWINAQGGEQGTGGAIDITTERFFRATDTFLDSGRQPVSISTSGGFRGGSMTIRHGGNGEVSFDVGSAERNGTAGTLTSGEFRIASVRSFPFSFQDGNIRILTRGEPESMTPVPGSDSIDPIVTDIETIDASPDMPDINLATPLVYLTPLTYDFDTIETLATEEFTEYWGIDSPPLQITIDDAQENLQVIEQETGIKPAILYAFFVPAPVGVQASGNGSISTNVQSDSNLNPIRSSIENSVHESGLSQRIPISGIQELTSQNSSLIASLPPSMTPLPSEAAVWAPLLLPEQSPETVDTLMAQAFLEREPEATDELELILVTTDSVVRRRIGGAARAEVQELADQFRNQITNPRRSDAYLSSAQSLYNWLVSPIEDELTTQDIGNIAFVMDVGLRSLPIAALHDGEEFIIERYSVGLMPTLSLTDTRYADVRSMNVLAMGAEQFSDLPPLPAVPMELEAITEDIWDGVALLNDDFTITNLQGQRSDRPYGIIHLATHGEFQPGLPQNSYIQFGSQRLQLTDLPDLSLNNPPVELLVLSACRTALGDREAELGFAGLALQAGVKSALASLWYISDTGTLAVMTEFYQELRQAPIKAEALRQAQLNLLQGNENWLDVVRQDAAQINSEELMALAEIDLEQLAHPYYWSAFTVIGSPW